MSIFSHLIRSPSRPREVHFLYGTKADCELDAQRILFLPRLMDLVAAADDPNVTLRLFLSGLVHHGPIEHGRFPNRTFARRITEDDLVRAIDGNPPNDNGSEHNRSGTVCYVCGTPPMTDAFVAFLAKQPGMAPERVLCEKWW